MKRLWIVLPGGGVKGIYQFGFLEGFLRLNRNEFVVEKIFGTSVGAILAPIVATNGFDAVKHHLLSIRKTSDVFRPWKFPENLLKIIPIFTKLGAYKKVKLVDDVLNSLQKAFPKETLDSAYQKCNVVAWNFMNKTEKWFSGEDLPIGIKASSALSLAVPPVSIKGAHYTDGGITELIPITKAIEEYEKDNDKDNVYILVVDCSTRIQHVLETCPKSPIVFTLNLIADASNNLSIRELDIARIRYPSAHIHYIQPQIELFDNAIDIKNEKIKRAYHLGFGDGACYSIQSSTSCHNSHSVCELRLAHPLI
jgi:predicted acylesterase/phospholipase RssA